MPAKFVAEEGDLKGLVLSLEDREEWVIGRDPDECQLVVEDPSTSRKHLVCRTTEKGIVLENLSDTNPVEINGEEIADSRLLKNGDTVKIGGSFFRFYEEGEVEVSEEAQKETLEEEESPEHDSIYEEASEEDKGILAEIDFDLRETGRWLLKVIGGPNNGAEFSMQSGHSYLIGTDPTTCDVVFHDTSVSRQHAKISISEDNTMTIEDLKSRNGTLIDSEPIEGTHEFEPNTLVTMGTTSFLVFDREGEMQTIISPLLPSIVKVLQKEKEKVPEGTGIQEAPEEVSAAREEAATAASEEDQQKMNAFVFIGILAGFLLIMGIGGITLFQSEPIQIREEIDYQLEIKNVLSRFPTVTYSFNENNGHLHLVGHVLTVSQKNELLSHLQGLDFVRSMNDSGLIIDEYVWRETNQVLARDPRWKGISIHSPIPGKFVLSGHLETRKEAEELSDYITANFPYLDLLDRRVIVEENVISSIELQLEKEGLKDLAVQMNNGEVSISGRLTREKNITLNRILPELRKIQGVTTVKTFISELAREESMVNISDRYRVTGHSNLGGVNVSVVINGRILSRGDVIDGMTITSIKENAIFLEKDGVRYRIDYER